MGNTAYAVYATLLTARLYFGLHAKCCSVACKHLKIILATDAGCCMTPIGLAAWCMTTQIATGIKCLPSLWHW